VSARPLQRPVGQLVTAAEALLNSIKLVQFDFEAREDVAHPGLWYWSVAVNAI
jgi:hypothetical protein